MFSYICKKPKVLNLPTTYKTLKAQSEGIYKEKGSKFIGIAVPCSTEIQAKEFLEKWRKEHFQARHLCYAYRFGANMEIYRANDDGEPSNSAGPPILGQIQSFELTNVLIGVVRYYGGVKLGVGGLINAYRTAAREALEQGEIITSIVKDIFELSFSYEEMPFIMSVIKESDIAILQQNFEGDCTLLIESPITISPTLLNKLESFSTLSIRKSSYV